MNSDILVKFGQMIMLGLDVSEINEEIIKLIQDYHIGGVVLYKKNYNSFIEMKNFINRLKEINGNNIPLFIAIDQENGRVNRLPRDITPLYNARSQASTKNLEIIDKCNEITATILKSVGVNMNFAPVLDIDRFSSNKVIGNRSYGNNYESVVKYGLPMMRKLKENNIVSVVKHFPGHGLTSSDSHITIPKIKNIKLMENEDIQIFGSAIKENCEAIMIGHLRVKGYGMKPATINKRIIDNYLIDRFNYNGLIVTDDLRMNTLKYTYGVRNLVKYSIYAGCNILMIKYKEGDIKRFYNEIYNKVLNGKISYELIDKSYNKIMKIKENYKFSNEIIDNEINITNINEEIEKINREIIN